jgi:formylglycine-generating enzyme required for sulfatase activity
VLLSRAFWLGVHPVTQRQYEAVTGTAPSWFRAGARGAQRVEGLDTSAFPVESVSRGDAVAFCERLAEAEGRPYRLPALVEWEHACRAGSTSKFHCGGYLTPAQANVGALNRPCPVGRYPPNGFGLHDLHGQVWEWCGDYGHEPYGCLKGGCFNDHTDQCRVASNQTRGGHLDCLDVGFRVALDWQG